MALPFYAATLFVSAFLLFLVQPMIGKMILPKLGGTPQVWNTCMLFFQSALLAGYAYTHTVGTRLSLRRQLMVHCVLLFLPLIVLFAMPGLGEPPQPAPGESASVNRPFNVSGFEAPPGANPILYTLYYLAVIVGLPFFVVSTSAPLLQKWFAGTGHPTAHDPYFLYGASNLGSLLALLAYPFVVEPIMSLDTQTWVWAGGYLALMVLVFGCAAMVWNAPEPVRLATAGATIDVPPTEAPAPPPEVVTAIKPVPASVTARLTHRKKGKGQFRPPSGRFEAQKPAFAPSASEPDVVNWWRRLRWILLAFVPSSLMLGVISYVSTDLSPFPLLWVAPLALYLLSFVLVFLRWPTPWTQVPHTVVSFIFPLFLLLLAGLLVRGGFDPYVITFGLFFLFFGVALYCHGELARNRPETRYLTDFYLCMSVGGMLGGVFNGLLAPVLFTGVAELPLVLIVAAFIRARTREIGWTDRFLTETFPNFGGWVRDRSDELSKALGKTPQRNPYILSIFLDVFFALIVLFLSTYIKGRATAHPDGWGWAYGHLYFQGSLEWFNRNPLFKFWKAMGMGIEGSAMMARGTFLLLIYGIPLLICFLMSHRPLRFGLGVVAFLFANFVLLGRDENYLFAGRSYFGVLRVFDREESIRGEEILKNYFQTLQDEYQKKIAAEPSASRRERLQEELALKLSRGHYTSMMHGTTLHGQNYFDPPLLNRLATTYYHRLGPCGVVMERYNWFHGNQTTNDTFLADSRMPAALVGLAASPLGVGNLPLDQLVHTWSEPPYATVGLGTGTMASYSRPFQHMTYYEIDQTVRNFSLPPNEEFMRDGQPFFTYLKGALDRGVNLEVVMGDARQTMQRERFQESNLFTYNGRKYGDTFPKREKYYKVMVIDAFSSDAIPIHLLTYEAVKLYSDKLADDGVLCIHTSNRHMDLVKPVVDIATKLKMKYRYGNDNRDGGTLGHTGSNYVMLAWDKKYIDFKDDPAFRDPKSHVYRDNKVGWIEPRPDGRYLWTDDYSNIVSVIR